MVAEAVDGVEAYAAPTKQCDVVMKGGITSGVVYPRAACHLARTYRFRQIGGASAGAIAAAFVAAAEHGRAHDAGPDGGFVRLHALPDDLGTRLSTLFQPSRSTRPAFALLTTWVEPEWGVLHKVGSTVARLVRHAPVAALAGFAIIALPAVLTSTSIATAAVWLPLAALVALVAAAVSGVLRTLKALPANGFGLCNGHDRVDAAVPPLTDWMAGELNTLAGLPVDVRPLTFGDLWGPEAVARHREVSSPTRPWVSPEERRETAERVIDLEVMTTNLTFRRPYRFPFDERIWFFCSRRMAAYFPDSVVSHLIETSEVAEDDGEGDALIRMVCPCHGEQARTLPAPPDLPVVIVARISLSFPILISAVPLLTVDRSRATGKQTLIETWFSDGGIASNFPVHLFDGFWPRRPTFAINLQPPHPDFPGQLVWKAEPGASGIVPRGRPMDSMFGFGAAIADTMQNWVDSTQITLATHRDRVAEVRHTEEEGGINLKMKPETITALADRGQAAAGLFDRYDFELHRWVRYRVEMSELDTLLDRLLSRFRRGAPDGYEAFLAARPSDTSYSHGSQAAARADREATAALMDVAAEWHDAEHPASKGSVPRPRPALRIVPRQ